MYNRDFGGVRSDGQMREFEGNWRKQHSENVSTGNTYSQKADNQQSGYPLKSFSDRSRRSEPRYYQDPPKDSFYEAPPEQETFEATPPPPPPASKGLFGSLNLDFLKKIELDDLILIGIGILLLLDSDANNDMLIILIAFMLFF